MDNAFDMRARNIERVPAVINYPGQYRTEIIPPGTNVPRLQIGFSARSLSVQNLNINRGYIYVPELGLYVATKNNTGSISGDKWSTINFPTAMEVISFEWHTTPFDPTNPGFFSGWAVITLYDEWIMPSMGFPGVWQ